MSTNPYAAPRAAVRDVAAPYQEVNLWSATGRIGRLRYLAYSTGASLLAGLVGAVLGLVLGPAGAAVSVVLYIAAAVFSIIAAIKRSHDMNWTGWSVLLMLIPLVGLIWVFKAGSEGENRFGAPPPPNTTLITVLGLLFPLLVAIGVVAGIAIPAYQDYANRALGVQ